MNRKLLYFACQRNGYYLPSEKCQFVTAEYLNAVMHNPKVFVLKYSDVRLAPCPAPPPTAAILTEVEKILRVRNLSIGDTSKF